MALILENTGEYSKALEKWQQLKTEEGCYKTVQILRKSQIIDDKIVFKYLEWVLIKMPEVGLSLFLERDQQNFKSSEGSSQKSGPQDEKTQKGGVIYDLTHKQILDYLERIEKQQFPKDELNLTSQKEETWAKVFHYRERYLEYIIKSSQDNKMEQNEKYQTELAELYIENMFRIQEKDQKGEILLPHLVNPIRDKLDFFLEKNTSYNVDKLLELIEDSWMFEEKIILLIKKKRYEDAVEMFVENEQHEEAEKFCIERPVLESTTLMTILW